MRLEKISEIIACSPSSNVSQTRALSATSSLSLNTSRDSDCITSLGSLSQSLNNLSGKKFFLMSNPKLLWHSFRLCPLVLLLFAWEQSLPPPGYALLSGVAESGEKEVRSGTCISFCKNLNIMYHNHGGETLLREGSQTWTTSHSQGQTLTYKYAEIQEFVVEHSWSNSMQILTDKEAKTRHRDRQ
ncbi:hypothetical protein WISP_12835 [Willisornis vidua]|uniref:Uncharacterized protein n=1 Tax=Willisornis vidua TaxID=1566151 RepID=A0ABQ9DWN2_9PASS|nr:hypothetical protein WISP_12835 [Willisornis vidua]